MVEFKQTFGSPVQVMNGTAKKTRGGLTKKNLKRTKRGSIVSKKKSALGKKKNEFMKLLAAAKKNKADMFEYNGKKYYRTKVSSGMVVYSKKKPKSGAGKCGSGGKSKSRSRSRTRSRSRRRR